MKKTRIAYLLGVCMICTLALAQGHRHQMPTVDDQVNRLSENLNLTDSQKTQTRTILQDQQDKMNTLRQNTSLSREDRHSKMMAIRQTASGQIRGLLNEDQQKKYDVMEQERQHNGRGGMGGDH